MSPVRKAMSVLAVSGALVAGGAGGSQCGDHRFHHTDAEYLGPGVRVYRHVRRFRRVERQLSKHVSQSNS